MYLSERVGDAMEQAERAILAGLREDRNQLLPAEAAVRYDGLDAESAAELVARVGSTADGCRFLIDAWTGLREPLADNRAWSPEQEVHALRLLGFGPRLIADPRALDLAVASRAVRKPEFAVTLRCWVEGHLQTYFNRDAVQRACERAPASVEQAFAFLQGVADGEIARLEGVLDGYLQNGDDRDAVIAREVEKAGVLASFDPSPQGEQLRRWQQSLTRDMLRTVEGLTKRRRAEGLLIEATSPDPADARSDEAEAVAVSPETPAAPEEGQTEESNGPNEAIVQEMCVKDEDRAAGPAVATGTTEREEELRLNRHERRRRDALLRKANLKPRRR
jgi:hypothetical protein